MDAFISYAKEDRDLAVRLSNDLEKAGCTTWLDVENLLPGQIWQTEIEKAIRECNAFIACLSNNSVTKKGFVQKELRLAIETMDYLPEGTPFILPARFGDCRPTHMKLLDIQWVDLFESWELGIDKILRTITILRDQNPSHQSTVMTSEEDKSKRNNTIFKHGEKKEIPPDKEFLATITVKVNSPQVVHYVIDLLKRYIPKDSSLRAHQMYGSYDFMFQFSLMTFEEIGTIVNMLNQLNGVEGLSTMLGLPLEYHKVIIQEND